jgi:hypothetical protein
MRSTSMEMGIVEIRFFVGWAPSCCCSVVRTSDIYQFYFGGCAPSFSFLMFEGGAHQLYELIIPEGAHPPYLLPRQDDSLGLQIMQMFSGRSNPKFENTILLLH